MSHPGCVSDGEEACSFLADKGHERDTVEEPSLAPIARRRSWAWAAALGAAALLLVGARWSATAVSAAGGRPEVSRLQRAPQVKAAQQPRAVQCLDPVLLNDFSCMDSMLLAGWSFNWSSTESFKPNKRFYGTDLSNTSYWGFSADDAGAVSLRLRGSGQFTLDFGNSWGHANSKVSVLLNDVPRASAGASKPTKKVRLPFEDGDVLKLVEAPNAVIVINHIVLDCESDKASHLRAQADEPTTKAPAALREDMTSLRRSGASEALIEGLKRLEALSPGPDFCNASAPIPMRRQPRAFTLPEAWQQRCAKLQSRPSGAADYDDRNWCWAWMKFEGCLWTKSHWSWWEAQERLSAKGKAPDPHLFPFHPLLNPGLCERSVLGASGPYSAAEAQRARKWVADNVAVYVLNLPTESSRWHRMVHSLELLGMQAERVFGVDLSKPGALPKVREQGLVPESYEVEKAQKVAEEDMGGLTGTVGVASGHFRALERACENRHHKPLAMILEDDTELVEDFAIRLWRLLSEVPCDWNAISLKSRCPYGECVTSHLTRVRPDGNEPAQRCHHGVNYGFYAMLYKAEKLDHIRQKLRETVWREEIPHCLDIDVALASISEEVPYYAVPAVQQPGFLHEGDQGSARYERNSISLSD